MSHHDDDYLWDKSGKDPEVERLEKLLAPLAHDPKRHPEAPRIPEPANRRWTPWIIAALCVAAVVAMVLWSDSVVRAVRATPEPSPVAVAPEGPGDVEPFLLGDIAEPWEIDVLEGTPSCNGEPIEGPVELEVGEWLETDDVSRARVQVADIGTMDVDPSSRLRLLNTSDDEHRFELAQGRIAARVLAPPRLLVVETPTVTAVDMGCQYTLEVADDGASVIDVTSGWVWLEEPGRTSMVPAGARAITAAGAKPGTPWFTDADPALAPALARLDAGDGTALATVLDVARPRDSLTLAHLIDRVPPEDRGLVWTRLEAISPVDPALRERALALDKTALSQVFFQVAATW